MYRSSKLRESVLWGLLGVTTIVLGIMCIAYKPLENIAVHIINKQTRLIDGTFAYNMWNMPLELLFKIYIFNVTNPDEVLKGDLPQLAERGPYVYNKLVQREILEIDEIADEIRFVIRSKFSFNKARSTSVSEDDSLTILNIAYIGTINTMAMLPSIMSQFGNVIPKLFPNPNTIFVKGKAKNILFDGLRLMCNTKRYPDLTMICTYLENSKPSIITETAKEGVYLFSLFNHLNDSVQGPLTINRGVRDINRLGDITSYRGDRIQKIWRTEECNVVSGKDPITWPPTQERLSQSHVFIADTCRDQFVDYTGEVLINGVKMRRYAFTEKLYELEDDCYCPEIMRKVECPPRGLLDLTKCQGGPIISSEPHFLHADPDLLRYTRGLNPNERLHSTDLTIHEMTGSPVICHKRVQLNMRVSRQPVDLLANVSEGYFPLAWTEETNPVELRFMALAYQTQRLIFLLRFLHVIPVAIGIYIILATIFLHGERGRETSIINPTAHSILIPHDSRVHRLVHGNIHGSN